MFRGGALAGGVSLCLSLGGCSLVLDFSEQDDAGPIDATLFDGPDAPDPCTLFEPNDMISDAVQIDPGNYGLGICPAGESDFLRFTVGANADVTIRISFSNTDGGGDLDLRLFDASDGAVVVVSEGFGDEELISRTVAGGNALAAGDYIIQIFPFSVMIQNNYLLELTIVEDMTPDAGIPDASIDAT